MHVLCLIAHPGDESNLCGGLLINAAKAGHRLSICAATDFGQVDTVYGDDAGNFQRLRARSDAFSNVCALLGAKEYRVSFPNERTGSNQLVEPISRAVHSLMHFDRPDLIVSHGRFDGGHPMHVVLYEVTRLLQTSLVWITKEAGQPYTIDASAKSWLAGFYRRALLPSCDLPTVQPFERYSSDESAESVHLLESVFT